MAIPEFELQNISFHYGRIAAISDLSLTVESGTRIALLGANGSGKSTLLRILDGLYFASGGSVLFRGESLTETRLLDEQFSFEFRRSVGIVFQNPDVQLFNPTVFEEVAFGPLQMRWPHDEIIRRVNEAMDFMQVTHLKDRPPHRLSGGEKKRVAIASVLVLDPQVLLLDEPTAALDPRSQSKIIELIADWKSTNHTVITATHQLDIVQEIADIAYVMQNGRLAASGTPQEILADVELLDRSNLVHAHRHHHGSVVHTHPHLHSHGSHEHEH